MTIYLVDEPFADLALEYAERDELAKVVLLQDAVYLARNKTLPNEVYVLSEDVVRRGLQSAIPTNVHIIDYGDLVDMMEAEKVVNFL
jgi:sulfur relay protein TusB/DsrH